METNDDKRVPAVSAVVSGTTVTLKFADGRALPFDVASASPEMLVRLALHGAEQKLRDAAALPLTTLANGRMHRPTVDEKYAAVYAVYERLVSGQWNAPRVAGPATGGLLFQCLQRMFPGKYVDVAAFDAWVDKRAEETGEKASAIKASLSRSKRVREVADAIRAEKGAPAADAAEDILAAMEAGDE